ncbi:MAG: hypothetical protein HY926_02385 [Elusimicrobia bacterium]|nr:hypothetical protein [Elusimicrobiota bacterium]
MASIRRHRVALRPKVRRRRLQVLAAGGALALLVCAAVLTVRHLAPALPVLSGLLGRLDLRAGHVTVSGVPASLAGPMEAYFNEPGDSLGSRLAGFSARFPAVRSWQLRRNWPGRGARLEVSLRRAVARLQRAGRPAGYLDEAGVAFAAPAELSPDGHLCVEIGGAGADRLQGLPALLEQLSRDADLPAPLARVGFRGPYEGWEISLQDGTQVLWGDLDWTGEKLTRLHEALSDARSGAAAAGPVRADLRFFGDGRVLLRPLAATRITTR